jgi:predicted ATPase/DNA-binding CsgD family transcriptional regulator
MAQPPSSSTKATRAIPVPTALDAAGFGSRLAAPLSSFIGREAEIEEIANLLRQDGVRLVTLTGPGGVGKTRLALQVVGRAGQAFADGTAAVSLAPVVNPSMVVDAIAQTLDVRHAPDRTIAEGLADLLQNVELLLLLDNFEHVVEAGRDIANLIAVCPDLTVLVTSREVLHLSGEHDVSVSPLPLPAAAAESPLASITASPAVRLFAERTRAAWSGFELTETNAPVVADICRRLDGLPLAIELAAARVIHLPLSALLERLDHSLPVLTGGPRDQPARQQAMRNTIAWSYDLLPREEQVLFRRLAVFAGGFTIDAAESVAADEISDVLAAISSLIDKSLLRQDTSPLPTPRYLMLETIREFALEQLEKSGEATLTSARHATHFKALTENVASIFYWGESDDRLAQIAAELPNLRAATVWALANGRAELALRFGLATRTFMISTNPREAFLWFEAMLNVPDIDPLVRADALWVAAVLAALTDLPQAAAFGDESRAIAAAHSDRAREVRALDIFAITAEWSGDFDMATALHREGLAIISALPDDPEVQVQRAWFVCSLADEHLWRNEPALARPLAEEALAWWRQAGMTWAIPFALQTLGAAACMLGDHETAAAHYGEALARRIELGDLWGTAGILEGIAGMAGGLGNRHEAVALLGAAAAQRDRLGVDRGPHWLRGKQVREAMQAQMTESAFPAAWDAGQALTYQQAIEQAQRVLADAQMSGDTSPGELTPREREVLVLIIAGCSNTEIGDRLYISTRTAQTHVTHILAKLDVATRTEAAARAVREGLV